MGVAGESNRPTLLLRNLNLLFRGPTLGDADELWMGAWEFVILCTANIKNY